MTGVRTPSLAARLDITLSLTCHDQPSLLLPHLLSLLPWDLGSILYHRSLDRLSPARSPLISRRISTLQPRGPSLRSRALPVLLPWVILFRGSRRFTIPPLSLDRFPSPLCRPPAPPPPLPHLSSSCSVSASSAKPFFPHLHHSPFTSWWNLLSLPWSLGTTHPSQRFASPLPFPKSEWCRSCNSHSLCLQLSASKSGRQRRAPPGFLQHNP